MPNIHWQQPGLVAKSETDGHGDTCGPIIILDYMHIKDPVGWPMTNARLDTLRQELINASLMNVNGEAGMTINQIALGFRRYGVQPIKVVTYDPNLPFQTFRQDLIDALSSHQMVCFETTNASNLPDNQPGVDYHFVLVGGIDTVQGYLVANGDAEYALGNSGAVNPYWIGVGSLSASVPCGYIVLPTLDGQVVSGPEVITLEKDSQGGITGGKDQNGNTIGAGFALAAEQQNLLGLDITTGERSVTVAGGHDVQLCVLGHVYLGTWTQGRPVRLDTWFEAAQAIEALIAESDKPPVTTPAPKFDYTAEWSVATAALDALHTKMVENGEVNGA